MSGLSRDSGMTFGGDLFGRLDRRLYQVERLGMWIAGAVILVTFLVMIGAVFTRPWTGFLFSLGAEGAKMLLWPMGFMPAAYLWRHFGHVRFDLVLRAVNRRTAHRLELANSIVVLVLVVVMTISAYNSYLDVLQARTRTLTMHLPYWPVFWCSVAGCALMAVEVLFSTVRHWRSVQGREHGTVAPWDVQSEGI